ncbi:MAG: DNA/RNA non-specific endonuclease [Candidatus Cryptobacteroides sp.]
MKTSSLILIALSASILFSCTESGIGGGEHISPKIETDKSVSRAEGQVFVKVTADGNWTLDIEYQPSDTEPWASLSRTEGEGSKSNIILSYKANYADTARILSLVLKNTWGSARAQLTQNGRLPVGKVSSSTSRAWMELPETKDDDGLYFAFHEMNISGKVMRNFSYYYDTHNLVSHWVAYPLNNSLRGSGGRTDAWSGVDPNFPDAAVRPIMNTPISGGYQRGHQCPSADRVINDAANMQTFYSTNMTPQSGPFNEGIWAGFEDTIRKWAGRSDTLYVVTGCVVNPNSLEGSYGSIGGYAKDNVGKKVAIPTAYYKAVLRYKKSEEKEGYGYGGYCGCAVYLEHDPSLGSGSVSRTDVISIDELEEIIGIDLFVNLPNAIGESKAASVEAQTPQDVGIWWPL